MLKTTLILLSQLYKCVSRQETPAISMRQALRIKQVSNVCWSLVKNEGFPMLLTRSGQNTRCWPHTRPAGRSSPWVLALTSPGYLASAFILLLQPQALGSSSLHTGIWHLRKSRITLDCLFALKAGERVTFWLAGFQIQRGASICPRG